LLQFVWITPNLRHSTHSCPLVVGDSFLSRLLPPLLRPLERDGLLFVTWDEGAEDSHRGCCALAAGGNIATIVAGGAARRRAVSTVPYDHYSLLETIEEAWGCQSSAARRAGARARCSTWSCARDAFPLRAVRGRRHGRRLGCRSPRAFERLAVDDPEKRGGDDEDGLV
jgi:hypothetical protein